MGRKRSAENLKYRKVEWMLYNIKKNKVKIKNLKLEKERVEHSYKGCGGFVFEERTCNTYKITSSVENEVIAKEERVQKLNNQIRSLEIQIEKIENALSILTEQELKIIELQYFKQMRSKDVAQQLLYTAQYYCSLKKHILDKLIDYIFIGTDLVSEEKTDGNSGK